MVYTRTYTHYFSREDLMPLLEQMRVLYDDWEGRREYVPEYDQMRGDSLFNTAMGAIQAMNERAD